MGRVPRRAIDEPSVTEMRPLEPDPWDRKHGRPSSEGSCAETQTSENSDLKPPHLVDEPNRGRRFKFRTTPIAAFLLVTVVATAVLVVSKNQRGGGGSTGRVNNPAAVSGRRGTGLSGLGSSGGGGISGGRQRRAQTSEGGIYDPDRIIDPMPLDLAFVCLGAFGVYFNGTATGHGANATLLQQCELECQAGDCCNAPTNFDYSCLTNNADTCANYRLACSILSVGGADSNNLEGGLAGAPETLPTPPTNLPDLCAINHMITVQGRESCAHACGPAACCYQEGVANCLLANAADCDLYAPCQNLKASAALRDELVAEIRYACDVEMTVTKQGRMKCNNVCKLGRCCFVGNDRCGKINPDPNFCEVQYQPCHVLYDGSLQVLPNDTYDSPGTPGGDDDFLDDDNYLLDDQEPGGGNGTDDEIADDDFVDDIVENTDANPWGINLDANGHPLLPAVADLQEACDAQALQDPTAEADCRKRCKQAQCCLFEPNLPQSCLAGNKAKCLQYQRWCGALFGNEDQTQTTLEVSAPAILSFLCSSYSLATEAGMAACQQQCQVAKCCFSWESETQCRDDTDCASFAPCLNLESLARTSPHVQDAVDEICTADTVQTYVGQRACQSVCLSHMCCWAADQPFCTEDVQGTCDLYEGCKYLRLRQDYDSAHAVLLPPPAFNLTEVCSAGTFGDQAALDTCQSSCAGAECCDLPENLEASCLKGNHLNCLRYHRACSMLQLGTDNAITVEPAPQDLAAWCSVESLGTAFGTSKCHEECDPYDCCWNDNGTIPCRTQPNCDGYSPCMALNAADTISWTISTEVNATCDELSVSTPTGLAVCQQVCLQHRCCWGVSDNDPVEMCFGAAVCRQYAACAIALQDAETDDFYQVQGDGSFDDDSVNNSTPIALPRPATNLTDVCAAGNLGDDPAALAICQSSCQVSQCCNVPENVEGSCLNDNYLSCLQYSFACSMVPLNGTQVNRTITVEPAPTDLAHWCSEASLGRAAASGTTSRCREACAPYECCWSDDNGTTRLSCRDQPNCDGYGPCAALNSAGGAEKNDTMNGGGSGTRSIGLGRTVGLPSLPWSYALTVTWLAYVTILYV